ncbi:MAG: HAD family hydrolase [Syntrophales bacterium]|jgi:phosphoglycolate phosphatase|nr:HAD family hydrolase [Syntrophales bacterium]
MPPTIPSYPDLKAFVFDFDGTIASLTIDFPEMRKAVLAKLKSFGIPCDGFRDLYVLEMISSGKQLIANRFPGQENAYFQQADALVKDIEINAARRGSLIDGIREMLIHLRSRSLKIGIVTRNCRDAVNIVFPDILSFVDIVLTRDETILVKPDPDHLIKVLEAFGLPAAKTAMVGDHGMDMKLAKDVGAYAIGVLTGHASAAELSSAGANMIINTASDIISFPRQKSTR